MTIHRSSLGQWFRSGSAGTYPINNGDPQCDSEDFNPDAADSAADEAEEFYHETRGEN
jgi:hypothetical protein